MSKIEGKIWGRTEPLLITPLIEVHKISIVPNAECSIHKHDHKHNMFYVLEGALYIDIHKTAYDLIDTTKILKNEWTSVKPGEFHQFRTERFNSRLGPDMQYTCIALEIYYIDPIDPVDIVRSGVGQVKAPSDTVTVNTLVPTSTKSQSQPPKGH